MRAFICAGFLVFAIGCGPKYGSVARPPAGPLARHHAQQYDPARPPDRGTPLDRRAAERITEISLERSVCYGTCPAYTITLRRDGSAAYDGYAYVKRLGAHTGRFDPTIFSAVAAYAEDIGFFEDSVALYYSGIVTGEMTLDIRGNPLPQPALQIVVSTDQPSSFVSIVRDGARKTVRSYGLAGPPRIRLLEDWIDGIYLSGQWRKR